MDKARIHELETQRANLVFALASPHLSQEQKAKINRMLNEVVGELVLLSGGFPRKPPSRESGELSPSGEHLQNEESS